MSKFAWGDSFWKLNQSLIERYLTCTTSEDIEEMQERIQEDLEREARDRKAEGKSPSLILPGRVVKHLLILVVMVTGCRADWVSIGVWG